VQAIKDKSDPKAVGKRTVVDQVSTRFRKLLEKSGLHRLRRNFYSLRHQFWSEAEAVLDTPAAQRIMGHADRSISDQYREYIAPERLERVVQHVHDWLFSKSGTVGATASSEATARQQ
jgi:integrase